MGPLRDGRGVPAGRFPTRLRIAAVVQAALPSGLLAVAVLSAAGLVLTGLRRGGPVGLAWVAVVVSALAVVLNAISPSAGERRVWVPVASGALPCRVCLSRSEPEAG